MPEHMSLRDRRAYALQIAFLSATRAGNALPPAEELEWTTDQVRSLAGDGADRGCSVELDQFLVESAQKLGQLAEIKFNKAPSAATVEILGKTQELVSRIVCKHCSRIGICEGTDPDNDDLIVSTNEAPCIHDIKSAFFLAQSLTADSIQRSVGGEPPDVKLVLETVGLMEVPGQIPGMALASNAQSTFDDSLTERRTRVRFEIAPLKLNRQSLAALPAIILHEVFCHGYQMARGQFPRPNRGAVVDPLSEGLMNELAVDCLDEFTRNEHPPGMPEARIWKANVSAAKEIAIARASLDKSPPFPQALEVSLGQLVLDLLCQLFELSRPESGKKDVRALAWALNLHPWNDEQRYLGLSRLADGLQAPTDATLLELLLTFPSSREVDAIIEYLTFNRQLSLE